MAGDEDEVTAAAGVVGGRHWGCELEWVRGRREERRAGVGVGG